MAVSRINKEQAKNNLYKLFFAQTYNGVKKNPFLLLLIVFSLLGTVSYAMAISVTLPNPLCPDGGACNSNCDGGSWSPAHSSFQDCCTAYGAPITSSGSSCISTFPDLIGVITDYAVTLIAALAGVMFILAGILFVTSAGNESRLGNAKKAFWWACIGTIIALVGKGLIAVITAIIGTP